MAFATTVQRFLSVILIGCGAFCLQKHAAIVRGHFKKKAPAQNRRNLRYTADIHGGALVDLGSDLTQFKEAQKGPLYSHTKNNLFKPFKCRKLKGALYLRWPYLFIAS